MILDDPAVNEDKKKQRADSDKNRFDQPQAENASAGEWDNSNVSCDQCDSGGYFTRGK